MWKAGVNSKMVSKKGGEEAIKFYKQKRKKNEL
jgi:hypothetical protein